MTDSRLPSTEELMLPVLEFVSDGRVHPIGALHERMIGRFKFFELSEEAPEQYADFTGRVEEAMDHLAFARLVEPVGRAGILITPKGQALLGEGFERITFDYLRKDVDYAKHLEGSKQSKPGRSSQKQAPTGDELVPVLRKLITDWMERTGGASIDLAKKARVRTSTILAILDGKSTRTAKPMWKLFRYLSGEESSAPSKEVIEGGLGTTAYSTTSLEEEACLNANQYARALARFVRGARDELCFGLFGHWGRGKTFLINLVARQLEQDDYRPVFFSAWKYPSTPRLWLHLYEVIRKEAVSGGILRSQVVALRAGLLRHGLPALLTSILTIAAIALPASMKLDALSWLVGVFGLAGVSLAMRLGNVFRVGSVALQRFLSITRHKAGLGLQAVVGEDLVALIVGWMPKNRRGEAHPTLEQLMGRVGTLLFGVSLAVLGAALFPWHLAHFGPAWWVGLAICTLLPALAFFVWWKARSPDGPGRILLVIDDLDRCDPGAMLEVAEGLKLFLEDERIKERVDVAMLVDEAALGRAILSKYRSLWTEHDAGLEPIDAREVLNENLEKIFVAHMRLDRLTQDELEEIARSVTAAPEDHALKTSGGDKTPVEPGGHKPVDEVDGPGGDDAEDPDIPKPPEDVDDERAFKKAEREAIASAAREFGKTDVTVRAGPRSIRCFIARYQLARLLLEEIGQERSPEQIAKAVLPSQAAASSSGDPVLNLMARQLGDVHSPFQGPV